MGDEQRQWRGVFTADQAAATFAEATDAARGVMAATMAGTVFLELPAGLALEYDRQAEARFREYLGDDPDALFCRHVPEAAQLYWFLVPGCPVACYGCIGQWMAENVKGTGEDSRCDICRSGPHLPGTYIQRMLVLSYGEPLNPGGPAPAYTILYSVCKACAGQEAPLYRYRPPGPG